MSTTVVVVAEVPMKERAEARVPAGVTTESAAAAAGGITVPRGSGASRHVPNADRKSPPLRPGPPRSPSSSPAKMKVGNVKVLQNAELWSLSTVKDHLSVYSKVRQTPCPINIIVLYSKSRIWTAVGQPYICEGHLPREPCCQRWKHSGGRCCAKGETSQTAGFGQ